MKIKNLFFFFFLFSLLLIPTTIFAETECATDNECADGEFCNSLEDPKICSSKYEPGVPCNQDSECQSNNCHESYCIAAETGDPGIVPVSDPGVTPAGDPGIGAAGNSGIGAPTTQALPNPLGETNINIVLGRIVKYIIGISGSVALVVFIFGGVMWMISAGRPDYVKKGRAAMMSAIIGLAIIFSSYVIIRFIIDAAKNVG